MCIIKPLKLTQLRVLFTEKRKAIDNSPTLRIEFSRAFLPKMLCLH